MIAGLALGWTIIVAGIGWYDLEHTKWSPTSGPSRDIKYRLAFFYNRSPLSASAWWTQCIETVDSPISMERIDRLSTVIDTDDWKQMPTSPIPHFARAADLDIATSFSRVDVYGWPLPFLYRAIRWELKSDDSWPVCLKGVYPNGKPIVERYSTHGLVPTGILVPEALASVGFWYVVLGTCYYIVLCVSRRLRKRAGRCIACAYPLIGLTDDVCPECGYNTSR